MKRLLLGAIVLSIAISGNSLTKNGQRQDFSRLDEEALWSNREMPLAQRFNDFQNKDFANCDPHGSGFRSKFRNLLQIPASEAIPVSGFPNRGDSLHSEFGLSESMNTRNLNCQTPKPTLLVALTGYGNLISKDKLITSSECGSKKCRRQETQGWRFQKPLYVEEPRWIEIVADYVDNINDHISPNDPFVLSRGKRSFEIRKVIEETKNSTVYYDGQFDFNDEEILLKQTTAPSQRLIAAVKFDSETKKKRGDKLGKKTFAIIPGFWRDKVYLNEIKNHGVYECPFCPSREKTTAQETSEKNSQRIAYYISRNPSVNERLRMEQPMRLKLSIAGQKENIGEHFTYVSPENTTDFKTPTAFDRGQLQIIDQNSPIKLLRDKRSDYPNYDFVEQDSTTDKYSQPMKTAVKSVKSLDYLDRRNKHSDIMEILEQPFFISRGKKLDNFIEKRFVRKTKFTSHDFAHWLTTLLSRIDLRRFMKSKIYFPSIHSKRYKQTTTKTEPADRRIALDLFATQYVPFYREKNRK